MGINPNNKITIIIRILFTVTLFQHQMFFLEISRRKIIEVDDLHPCVFVDGWSRFTLHVRDLGVSNVRLGNLP
jgi:hypothetical protein